MSRVLLVLISLCLSVTAFAQEIKSPQALAEAVAAAVTAGRGTSLETLIDPKTRADTKRLVVHDVMNYKGSAQFTVKSIAPNDKAWEGLPLAELRKKQAARGYAFPTQPLGQIVVAGKRPGNKAISKFVAFYGKFDKQYLLMFAVAKNKGK
jgi:hypothetical protein